MKNNYYILASCENCTNCVQDSVQDDGVYYYCALDGTFNPDYLSGGYPLKDGVSFEEAREWSGKHSVEANGICDDYLRMKLESEEK